jgi:hypothetical protein
MTRKLTEFVAVICTLSLASILVATSAALLYGLFDKDVSNEEIFKVLSPAFNAIGGGFIGLVTGIKLGLDDDRK